MKGARRAPRCLGQWPGSCRVVDQRGTARKLDTGLLLVLWGIWSGDFPAAEEVSPWGCFCFGLACLVRHLEKKVRPPCPGRWRADSHLGGGDYALVCFNSLARQQRRKLCASKWMPRRLHSYAALLSRSTCASPILHFLFTTIL